MTGPCVATAPWAFKIQDWKGIFQSTWHHLKDDNVSIVAAGVAFFTMLAIFPLITACISLFGLLADPIELQVQLQVLANLFPAQAWTIIDTQIMAVASAPAAELGIRIALSLLIAFWSAGAGIRAMMRAMNIAYGENEKRGILRFYSLAGALTLSVTIFLWLSLAVIIGVPAVLTFFKLNGMAAFVAKYLPWILLVLMFAIATAILYRFGPSRHPAKLKWIVPGVLFATIMWLLISSGFSKFVAEFGSYNKTYGSLSAVILLLIWFWLTALMIILGAEINASMERQTQADTTTGPDQPLGQRGAFVADFMHQVV